MTSEKTIKELLISKLMLCHDLLGKAEIILLDVLMNNEFVFFNRSELAFQLVELISKKHNLSLEISKHSQVINLQTDEFITYPLLQNELGEYFKIIEIKIWLNKLKFDKLLERLIEKKNNDAIFGYNSYIKLIELKKQLEDEFLFKFYSLDTLVNFGKYKGMLIEDIIRVDPGILVWYNKNLSHFILNWDVLLRKEILMKTKDSYLDLLKSAIIKNHFAWNYIYTMFDIDDYFQQESEQSNQRRKQNRQDAKDYYWSKFDYDTNEL